MGAGASHQPSVLCAEQLPGLPWDGEVVSRAGGGQRQRLPAPPSHFPGTGAHGVPEEGDLHVAGRDPGHPHGEGVVPARRDGFGETGCEMAHFPLSPGRRKPGPLHRSCPGGRRARRPLVAPAAAGRPLPAPLPRGPHCPSPGGLLLGNHSSYGIVYRPLLLPCAPAPPRPTPPLSPSPLPSSQADITTKTLKGASLH